VSTNYVSEQKQSSAGLFLVFSMNITQSLFSSWWEMLPAENSLRRFCKEGWRSFGKIFVNLLLYNYRVRALTEFVTLNGLLDLSGVC
jgi:DNA-binding transcriptional regulator of glucitol operon